MATTKKKSRSGGINFKADRIRIDGDVAGRDIIQNIQQRALTAAEEARQARSIEAEYLANGVGAFAQRLRDRADETSDAASPYKGLLEYDLGDAALFHGRAAAIDAVQACIKRGPLTVLHADSGMGKTSLLRAGIEPRLLANGHVPLYVRPHTTSVSEAIKRSLVIQLEMAPNLAAASLRDFLRQVTVLLGDRHLVVILDQFEAVFTAQTAQAREEFVAELAICLDDNLLSVHWILALRSNGLGQLSSFQSRVRQPLANEYLLGALTHDEAEDAIRLPAEQRRLTYEPGLVEQLIDDLGKGKDGIAPPQLQLVCHTLVERLASGEKHLTLDGYDQLGRADGILRDYLDSVLARSFQPADRTPAWQLLAAIADRNANQAALTERLKTYAVSEADTCRVLDQLETSHLVQRSDERYQLTSDSLLPRIRQWASERAARELARAEVIRQVERVRNSALRGMLGGALGFSLAFLLTYGPQTIDKSLLLYITAYRAVPGALAGLLLIFVVDVAQTSYHGPRRWMRWPVGGSAGAASFALALLFHAMLRTPSRDPLMLLSATGEGALWGAVVGLGTVWVMDRQRPLSRTLLGVATVTLVGGLALWAADALIFGKVSGDPPSLAFAGAAGAFMPLCVLVAALLAPKTGKEVTS